MAIKKGDEAAVLAYRQRLGKRIVALRGEMSQRELCRRTGLDQSYVSLVEAGKKEPAVTTLWRLAKGLGISVSELTDC